MIERYFWLVACSRPCPHGEDLVGISAGAVFAFRRRAHNIEAEPKTCEIRLRAERRSGQLLKEREMAKRERPAENPSQRATGLEPLSDLGISKTQHPAGKKLAEIPPRIEGRWVIAAGLPLSDLSPDRWITPWATPPRSV